MDGCSIEKQSVVNISIYRVVNQANGKVYVGQTRLPKRRWTDHQYAASKGVNTYFCSAIRKYGASSFVYEIMEVCTLPQADNREMYWIKRLKATNRKYGYNTSIGGTSGNNSTPKEVRDKISKAKKGVTQGPWSPERAKKISEAKLASGYRHSNATKQRIAENRKVTTLSDEWRQKISEGLIRAAKYLLDDKSVADIEELLRDGVSKRDIVAKYKISRKTLWRIEHGEYGIKRKTLAGEYKND